MLIRSRTRADLNELIDLARSVHRHDGYPPYLPDDDFEGFLRSGNRLAAWVSVDGTAITGHVSLHGSSSPGVVELAATKLGVIPVLDVVEHFAPAIALYERAGWSRLGSIEVQLPDGSTMREHVYSEKNSATT